MVTWRPQCSTAGSLSFLRVPTTITLTLLIKGTLMLVVAHFMASKLQVQVRRSASDLRESPRDAKK